MAYQPVAPFFKPGAPPPPLPLLTCQTDLSGIPNPKPTITISESLSTFSRAKERQRAGRLRPAPYLRPANRTRSPSPYTKPPSKAKIVTFASVTSGSNRGRSESQESELSELSELSDFSSRRSPSEFSTRSDLDGGLIVKPLGEVGRPNRGGYNLERVLNWDPESYTKFQKFIHKLVDERLNITQSYQRQDESLRQAIRNAAASAFPQLISYEGCWPVNDLMLLRLKNTARREKLKLEKEAAAAARAVIAKNDRKRSQL